MNRNRSGLGPNAALDQILTSLCGLIHKMNRMWPTYLWFKCNYSAKNGTLVTHVTLYKVKIFII